MKTLYVVRHAKSSWEDPSLSDFDRPLNKRGYQNAPEMGNRLSIKGVVLNGILCSPAKRARDTCTEIAKKLGTSLSIITYNRELYHANEHTCLKLVRCIEGNFETAMIVGHNPGITSFVNKLTESTIDNVPTCGIACCTFSMTTWEAIQFGVGKLVFYDYPKRKTN